MSRFMMRPALFIFTLSTAPLFGCQQGGQATTQKQQAMNVQAGRAQSETRAVQIIFADFYRTNARLLMDGERVFDGPLDVQQTQVGISKTIEMRIAIGRRTFHLTSGPLDVTRAIEIGRQTQTIIVTRFSPYIQASNDPGRFD